MDLLKNRYFKMVGSVALHVLLFIVLFLKPGTAFAVVAFAISSLQHLGFHGSPSDVGGIDADGDGKVDP
jgi:hypothetical protein